MALQTVLRYVSVSGVCGVFVSVRACVFYSVDFDHFQVSGDEWVEASTPSGGGGEKPWKVEQEATPSSTLSTNQVRY